MSQHDNMMIYAVSTCFSLNKLLPHSMFPLLNASFSPKVEYQMEANNKGLLFFLKQKGTKMKFSTASFFSSTQNRDTLLAERVKIVG